MQPSTSDLKKTANQVQNSATKAYGKVENAAKDLSKELSSEAESRLPEYYSKAKDIASDAWTTSLDVAAIEYFLRFLSAQRPIILKFLQRLSDTFVF